MIEKYGWEKVQVKESWPLSFGKSMCICTLALEWQEGAEYLGLHLSNPFYGPDCIIWMPLLTCQIPHFQLFLPMFLIEVFIKITTVSEAVIMNNTEQSWVFLTQFPPMVMSWKTIAQYHDLGMNMVKSASTTQVPWILLVLLSVCVFCIVIKCVDSYILSHSSSPLRFLVLPF